MKNSILAASSCVALILAATVAAYAAGWVTIRNDSNTCVLFHWQPMVRTSSGAMVAAGPAEEGPVGPGGAPRSRTFYGEHYVVTGHAYAHADCTGGFIGHAATAELTTAGRNDIYVTYGANHQLYHN